jgi:hypothetical protein
MRSNQTIVDFPLIYFTMWLYIIFTLFFLERILQMNKKLIALVAALFVATSANATYIDRTWHQSWPNTFESVEQTKALAAALEKPAFNAAYTQEKNFQQNIQLGILAGAGIVVSTIFGCLLAEWIQEFKIRKAEKAKLLARLNCETRQIKTTCYVS